MTHQVKGVVDNAFTRTKTSKAGKDFTIHYITVDGVEVSTGFKKEHEEGQLVNLAVEYKYKEWQKIQNRTGDGLPEATAGGPTGGASNVSQGNFGKKSGGSAGGRSFPVDPTDGQMSIIRQNSMNRAVEIMAQLYPGGYTAPADDGPTVVESYLEEVQEIALVITDFNSGQDLAQQVAAAKAKKAMLAANGGE